MRPVKDLVSDYAQLKRLGQVVSLPRRQKERLYSLLNQHKVYESFAEKLGSSKAEIRSFKSAEEWLEDWGRRRDATVKKLLNIASDIEDAGNVMDYLEELMNQK